MLVRRLGPGLAGVGTGNPPQRLKNEIVSAPTHLTGLEWCVEALCKCTRKMLSENNMRSTTLRFYYYYFFSSTFIIYLSPGFSFFPTKSEELFTSPATPRTRAAIDPPPAKCSVAGQCGIFQCKGEIATAGFMASPCLQQPPHKPHPNNKSAHWHYTNSPTPASGAATRIFLSPH